MRRSDQSAAKQPIIAVTGSSGAGLSTIRHAFKSIFERLNIKPANKWGQIRYS
ncbi:hypothetical protein [Thiobacillus sp.]|uniref:hypothetical protein n=1 Tax=Thiobacillus sp. TaxID=924 RepID=UPI0025D9FD12|nr:hypothetical protein [Thiobacillus sp.]